MEMRTKSVRQVGRHSELLASALAMISIAVNVQAQESSGEQIDEIVVTGSNIRGVAPVGSNLVTLGQEDIESNAATNVTELVNTISSITSKGAAPQGENVYSSFAPSIHGIGGSSSTSTLVIIDGLRMPGGGTQYVEPDPNIIPTTALQRVEVLTDGASSVYGSDAVSGVVNFITRKTFDGAQANVRTGFADGYRNYDASGILGRVWDTGGVYVAGQITEQDAVYNIDRPFISRGDYRDVGGSNTNSFDCLPATIRTIATGSDFLYASPGATDVTENDVSENGFCNNSIYGAAIPGSRRENILATAFLELGERASLLTKVNYNHLEMRAGEAPGTARNVTVFGPGSPADRSSQVNPFFMAPAGEPGATEERVNYIVLRPNGDYGEQVQTNDTIYTTSVLAYDVSDTWTTSLSVALGRSNNTRGGDGLYCSVCAILAANGTTQSDASTTASSAATGSVVVTDLPLTADNALDVWQGPGSNRTSPEVLDFIYSNNEELRHLNTFQQFKAQAEGYVFSLPAGEARVAFGSEYITKKQHVTNVNNSNISNTLTASSFNELTFERSVYSGFAELYIPVTEDVELIVSGRYDHYSDFGGTTNPKISANWRVTPGVKLRANYGKSFVAPKMRQIGDASRGFTRGANGAGLSEAMEVPVGTYPEVLGLPGCATATGTCRIGTAANPGLTRSLGAGLAETKPQLGESWSVGIDLAPDILPDLNASITYWSTTFTGATSLPALELLLYSGALHDRLTICPTGCTADEIRTFTNVDNGAPFNALLPPTVYFMIDRNLRNLLNFDVQGIDAQFEYGIETNSAGTFTVGGSMTYFTRYDQWFLDAPKFSILNTSGYNSQFPSIQTRGRVQVSWERDGFFANLFTDFTGSYRNYKQSSVAAITLDANGNPNGGGDVVDASYIFGLNLAYEGSDGFLEGKRLYLDVKNLFDEEPSFYNGNTFGIGVGGWGFNGFTSNPIGRIVSVGFSIETR